MLTQNADMPPLRIIVYAGTGLSLAALIGYALLALTGGTSPEHVERRLETTEAVPKKFVDLGPLIGEQNGKARR